MDSFSSITYKNDELSENCRIDLEDCICSYEKLETKIRKLLIKNEYEHLQNINYPIDLKNNLRIQIEKLNAYRNPNFKFSDSEWNLFFQNIFEYRLNLDSSDRSEIFTNEDFSYPLTKDGETKNIYLIDRDCLANNKIQFISKEENGIVILINGIPSVHLIINNECGTTLEHIFEPRNLKQYTNTNFGELLKFVQIFVISNGKKTKYFSNTIKDFKHTSNWSYFNNEHINNIFEFIQNFFNHKVLLNIITKYLILDSFKNLIILRPYQIAAIEKIIDQVNDKDWNTKKGGCIWHTTGSGKTLTSWKSALLAIKIPEVEKVIFAVDRNDLYTQTSERYKSFSTNREDDLIFETDSTKDLQKKLYDCSKKIILTTIQKLQKLQKLDENIKLPDKKIVIIMDECHRSQTRKLHIHIKNLFNQVKIFGFTGTPRFEESEEFCDRYKPKQTIDIFGKILHDYKMTEAINDGNILVFDIFGVPIVNTEDKLERIQKITKYTLENYENVVKKGNKLEKSRFNSIFATESIDGAIEYYKEFERQIKEKNYPLKIAIIYSATSDTKEGETNNLNKKDEDLEENHKKFLLEVYKKYEKDFNIEIKGFNQYRNSVSKNTKERKIDILIVVNMFLTGFDAPTLNTLWLDKHLEGHNLIQAFSRTNRNFDESKPHGNIVCFRNLKDQVDKAISTFADGDQRALFVESYEIRKAEFDELERILINNFPIEKEIIGESKEYEFIEKYNKYNKLSNSLSDDYRFTEESKLIKEQQRQDYRSIYLDIYEKYKKTRNKIKKDNSIESTQEPDFELESFRADEINIDYIIDLLSKYKSKDKEYKNKILRIIRMYETMRKIENIVLEYLNRIDNGEKITYHQHKSEKIKQKIKELGSIYGLQNNYEDFIQRCIENNRIGVDIRKIMPSNMDITKQYKEYLIKLNEVRESIREILDMYTI